MHAEVKTMSTDSYYAITDIYDPVSGPHIIEPGTIMYFLEGEGFDHRVNQ